MVEEGTGRGLKCLCSRQNKLEHDEMVTMRSQEVRTHLFLGEAYLARQSERHMVRVMHPKYGTIFESCSTSLQLG
jgi:hypothetical protein